MLSPTMCHETSLPLCSELRAPVVNFFPLEGHNTFTRPTFSQSEPRHPRGLTDVHMTHIPHTLGSTPTPSQIFFPTQSNSRCIVAHFEPFQSNRCHTSGLKRLFCMKYWSAKTVAKRTCGCFNMQSSAMKMDAVHMDSLRIAFVATLPDLRELCYAGMKCEAVHAKHHACYIALALEDPHALFALAKGAARQTRCAQPPRQHQQQSPSAMSTELFQILIFPPLGNEPHQPAKRTGHRPAVAEDVVKLCSTLRLAINASLQQRGSCL